MGTPQCLLAEGLADLALEVLLGADHRAGPGRAPPPARHPLRHRGGHGGRADAGEALSAVRGNAALILHDRGGSEDDAIAELSRWGLLPRERAAKSISFLTHPTWRAYIFCYVAGLPLCRGWVGGDPARFERLLSEQFVPADLVAA